LANKSDNRSRILNLATALFALLTFVSLFFNFIKLNNSALDGSYTGFGLMGADSGYGLFKAFAVILCIAAAITLLIALMRAVGMLDGKMFTIIYMIASVALLISSIVMFASALDANSGTVFGITLGTNLFVRAVGAILNLIFAILTCLSALATGYLAFKSAKN
jgi:hypothetical protein